MMMVAQPRHSTHVTQIPMHLLVLQSTVTSCLMLRHRVGKHRQMPPEDEAVHSLMFRMDTILTRATHHT